MLYIMDAYIYICIYLSNDVENVFDDDRYGEQNKANNGYGPSWCFL